MKNYKYNRSGRRVARDISGRSLIVVIVLVFVAAVLFSSFWK